MDLHDESMAAAKMDMRPIQRILVATDFSACSEAAGEAAGQLTRQLGAAVELVTVVDVSSIHDRSGEPAWRRQRVHETHQEARRRLRSYADRHFAGIDQLHIHAFDGGYDPPDVGEEVARLGDTLRCDLIVLGTHGKTGLEHLILGSVAEKVVRNSRVPVLTVRAPANR
jgi:nucleotide-binding universal stress UspA family protein